MLRFFSLLFIILLSGCFSGNPDQVIIIDKSINQYTAQSTPKKPGKTRSNKPTKSWSIPVEANISKTFSKQHQGLRFSTKSGQAIRAVRDGVVVYSGDKMTSHGQMIIIKHPFGFYSSYTQGQNLKVSVGDTVNKGQTIASTSEQPFYFEMKKFSTSINPTTYLK